MENLIKIYGRIKIFAVHLIILILPIIIITLITSVLQNSRYHDDISYYSFEHEGSVLELVSLDSNTIKMQDKNENILILNAENNLYRNFANRISVQYKEINLKFSYDFKENFVFGGKHSYRNCVFTFSNGSTYESIIMAENIVIDPESEYLSTNQINDIRFMFKVLRAHPQEEEVLGINYQFSLLAIIPLVMGIVFIIFAEDIVNFRLHLWVEGGKPTKFAIDCYRFNGVFFILLSYFIALLPILII